MPKAVKVTLRFFLVLLIIGLSLGAVGGAMWLSDWVHNETYVEKEIPDYDPTKPIPAEALREDFAIIRGAIEDEHGGPYIYTPKEELSAMFDAAYEELDKPMSEIEFVKLVGPIVHAVHDGHTNLSRPDDIKDYLLKESVRFFPLVSYFEKNRVLVWNDGTPEGSVPRGSEILAVDGEPIERFVKRVTNFFVSTDGYTFDAARDALNYESYLNHRFLTYLSYLKGFPETYEVTFQTPQGDEKTVQIKSINIEHLSNVISARYPNPPGEEVADDVEEAATRLHWEGDVPVLTVDSFDDDSFDEYAAILEGAFAEIHERGARNLIVDFRENGGGMPNRGFLLMRHFGIEDVPIYRGQEARVLHSKYVKYSYGPWSGRLLNDLFGAFLGRTDRARNVWVGRDAALTTELNLERPPFFKFSDVTSPPFKGQVYLLVGGGTFSAASELAVLARTYLKPLIVVGQETAGTATGMVAGVHTELILPHTRLGLRVPHVRIDYVGSETLEPGRGVLPDVEVWPTFEDALAGRDRVMERALELAQKQTPNVEAAR